MGSFIAQLNIYNKLLIFVLFVLVLCHLWALLKWKDRYHWSASVCDPIGYPTILKEYHSYISTTKSQIYYFKEAKDHQGVRRNWYNAYPQDEEEMAIPDELTISWYSLREDKYYQGTFKLPKKLLKTHFKKGYTAYNGKPSYVHFIDVGLTPGGGVHVWLARVFDDWKIKIDKYQAKEIESPFKDIDPGKQVWKSVTEDGEKEAIELAIENDAPIPFDHWDYLDRKWNYSFVFDCGNNQQLTDELIIMHLNAEITKHMITSETNVNAALPKAFTFYSGLKGEKARVKYLRIKPENLLRLVKDRNPKNKLIFKINYDEEQDVFNLILEDEIN